MYERYVKPEVFRKRYSRVQKQKLKGHPRGGGFWTADKIRGRDYIFIVCEGCYQLLTAPISFFNLDSNELSTENCIHCYCDYSEHDHYLKMKGVPKTLRDLIEEKCFCY